MEFKQIIQNNPSAHPKQFRKKKKRYSSPSQRTYFIKLWKESLLNKTQFCAQHHIQTQTLTRWLRQSDVHRSKTTQVESKKQSKPIFLDPTPLEFKLPNV